MEKIINQSDKILFKARTVFPFTFFPHEIVIDENKINFIESKFIGSKYVRNMLIANVADIRVSTTPFFSTLTIMDMSFNRQQQIKVPYLWQKDAIKARDIINGLIVAKKEGIDTTKFTDKKLIDDLQKIGNIKGEEFV